MKKIIPIMHKKIWGYELWLTSPLKGLSTKFEQDNQSVNWGPIIKIIHAKLPLSIQVHPDDKLAYQLEKEPNGKSESWYVLDCDKNSKMVVGLSTYNVNIIKEAIEKNTIEKYIKTITPKIDQFINIEAGLVHGIGLPNHSNITVLEVQQPSDITYRFWDYNRLDDNGNLRQLHKEKALKCIKNYDFNVKPIRINKDSQFQTKFYKITLIKNNKQAWNKGFAITKNKDQFYAYEISKNDEFPLNTVFFVEENKI